MPSLKNCLKYILSFSVMVILTSCDQSTMETFSPTYHGSGCVPYGSGGSYDYSLEFLSSGNSYGEGCCEGSWPVMCCFGGIATCADGSQSVRSCGCPDI